MQLCKSLVGGIIGVAVGIGLLLVVYLLSGIDKVWLAIPFAVVVGLGVRMIVSTTGHASYVRGALTMLLALGGYIAGWYLVAQVATARANAPIAKPPASEQKSAEPAPQGDAPAEAAPATPPPPMGEISNPSGMRRPMAAKGVMSAWDMIFLGIAALIAYEMGRGSGMAPVAAASSEKTVPADATPPV